MNKLLELRKKHGWSMQKLADRLDPPTSAPQIKRLEDGERTMSVEWANKFAKVFNVPASTFLALENNLTESKSSGYTLDNNNIDVGNESILIPEYEVYVGAGSPALGDDKIIREIKMPKALLREVTASRGDELGIVKVQGDSMYPRLKHRDMVVFDTTMKIPMRDKAYVIHDGEGLVVKYCKLNGDKLELISENEAYKPYSITHNEHTIVGCVVWTLGGW